MSWCSDAPEDEAISLFAGLLANPDVRLSLHMKSSLSGHKLKGMFKFSLSKETTVVQISSLESSLQMRKVECCP